VLTPSSTSSRAPGPPPAVRPTKRSMR
jgi:hypothetical protein